MRKQGAKTSSSLLKNAAQTQVPRSTCPLEQSLEVFGDRWTLLVIRDLFDGKRRFKDFMKTAEGIPSNILSERLSRLLESGLICRVPDQASSKFQAYALTPKGRSLGRVLSAIRKWGEANMPWQNNQINSTPL